MTILPTQRCVFVAALVLGAFGNLGCSVLDPTTGPNCGSAPGTAPASTDLLNRAYIVSRDSSTVNVINLKTLTLDGSFETCSGGHMLELNEDFSKAYLTQPETNEAVVVDTRTFAVAKRIPVASEPTHLNLSRDGRMLGLVNENANSVTFIDTANDTVVKEVSGFFKPHFVRFSPDGQFAYVANLRAHHITRVALSSLTIDGTVALDGFESSPTDPLSSDDDGFADVQIDLDGVLYAAHAGTGRVLVYDTKSQLKQPDVTVGIKPWIVYAEHPFKEVLARVVPNFGDSSVSILQRPELQNPGFVSGADHESFGVNYSPIFPTKAFVMNRFREEVAVMDTEKKTQVDTIDVGGTTETASTTADGKWIVATVSSRNRVVVIDADTHAIVKTFEGIGNYPWSVTIPLGQNYCH